MKKEVRLLRLKSIESLILSIELFNRPWDTGRTEGVLILLDRAFELLFKAVILHKGGKIREPGSTQTIGFDKCVRKCVSDAQVQSLSEDQALTPQIINSLRDAAQHYVVEISEQQLYMYAQAGMTLYADLLSNVFDETLRDHLPERVLPVSTSPPRDLHALMSATFNEIKDLVVPGSRRKLEARARVRALAIIEASLSGVRSQPGERELDNLLKAISEERDWTKVFPGVASLSLTTEGTGLSVSVRITKKEGEAVQLVPEGNPDATVVAVKRVNELGYYTLGLNDLAEKLGLTRPKAGAVIAHLAIQGDEKYYKEITIGSQVFKRYSPQALAFIREKVEALDMDEVWRANRPRRKRK